MSFDLDGLKSKNKTGNSFHNSAWEWRPLWRFIIEKCPKILTQEQIVNGESNNGCIVSADQCQEIATCLDRIIKAKDHEKYAKDWTEFHTVIPRVTCNLCKGTGKRYDDQFQGRCDKCRGTGECRSGDCDYPFMAANVEKFYEFVKNCGGFTIG